MKRKKERETNIPNRVLLLLSTSPVTRTDHSTQHDSVHRVPQDLGPSLVGSTVLYTKVWPSFCYVCGADGAMEWSVMAVLFRGFLCNLFSFLNFLCLCPALEHVHFLHTFRTSSSGSDGVWWSDCCWWLVTAWLSSAHFPFVSKIYHQKF